MECRDHARGLAVSAARSAARAQKRKARRTRAGKRCVSFLEARPFLLSECLPFAFLRLADERGPRLVLRVEDESVALRCFLRIEVQFERVFRIIELATAKRRFTRTINIHPLAAVTLR